MTYGKPINYAAVRSATSYAMARDVLRFQHATLPQISAALVILSGSPDLRDEMLVREMRRALDVKPAVKIVPANLSFGPHTERDWGAFEDDPDLVDFGLKLAGVICAAVALAVVIGWTVQMWWLA